MPAGRGLLSRLLLCGVGDLVAHRDELLGRRRVEADGRGRTAPWWRRMFMAMARPWMISGASAPTMWAPTTRRSSRSTTSFIIVRSSRPVSVCFIGRKLVM